ncbi:MAG: UDP-N-acetylglucosamine 2-epimerase (non-hydrolyzing) [Defluviitaleaceae bacterium]|nr:UDP-N-acetylglucosamine 2-epimerase (non-hydrolyzing) [Defluviitaleaceae bacterium]MCL2275065.1 UDP-N-acetylglucosamine 2-epimerase (non-hydrolyzing) [Defluviitaleaceae bacterium]
MGAVKVLTVFGTRAEANKMIPLVLALQERAQSGNANPVDSLQVVSHVCVTAQHRELLDQSLAPFGVVPDVDLNIMTAGQNQGDVTGRILARLAPVLEEYKPDIVLVHGDTTTTFAAALAAFHAKVAVGHVEAGLRTYDKFRPYPEEMNRKLTTALADLHFAPTALAREYLLKENVPADRIFVTGNTAVDMLAHTTKENYKLENTAADAFATGDRVILMTVHRRENFGAPMDAICRAVARIATDFPTVRIIWPMHPNGAGKVESQAHLAHLPNVLLTQATNLQDTHNLMKRSYLILSDSGGIQEEAPSFNVPVVVLRETTERPEGLTVGTLVLAGVAEENIYNESARLLTDASAHKKMATVANPFGDGAASERIVDAVVGYFGKALREG